MRIHYDGRIHLFLVPTGTNFSEKAISDIIKINEGVKDIQYSYGVPRTCIISTMIYYVRDALILLL